MKCGTGLRFILQTGIVNRPTAYLHIIPSDLQGHKPPGSSTQNLNAACTNKSSKASTSITKSQLPLTIITILFIIFCNDLYEIETAPTFAADYDDSSPRWRPSLE